MTASRELRSAFGPEALSTFAQIFEEVWIELVADDVFPLAGSDTGQCERDWPKRSLRLHRLAGPIFRLNSSC
jgi:hypothetical protein